MGEQGATGAQGAEGPQGIQGPAGQVLVLDGGVVVGPPGSSVVVTPIAAGGSPCPTGGVRITQLSDGGISNVCNGDVGAIGPQGPAGAQGATGATGAAGPQGPAGLQGAAGPQGPQGQTGAQGATGATGSIGPQGPAGAMGPQGQPGVSVSAVVLPSMSPSCVTGGVQLTFADGGVLSVCNGAVGPTGATGLTGSQGPAGATGSAGATGPAGPQGPAGPMGPALYLDGGVATPPPPRFVGFTTATYDANLGGVFGANAKCRAQYAGSQFCTLTDYRAVELDSSTVPPGTGAWVDTSRDSAGQRQSGSCSSWTYATNSSAGSTVTATGNGSEYCNTVHSIACCAMPTTAQFVGVTAATFDANLGGIPGANSKCRAEYPGTFFCSVTDVRAAELSTFPVASAWVDTSRDAQGRRQSGSCSSWTYATNSSAGSTMTPTGSASEYCNTAHPVSCCR